MSAIMGDLIATAATGAALATDVVVIGAVVGATESLAGQQRRRERKAAAPAPKRARRGGQYPRMLEEWF